MSKNDTQHEFVPQMRFPQFRTNPAWILKPLGDLSIPIKERVGESDCIPFTITAGEGLISQEKKYGRTIAGKSLKNYYRLQHNDFAFNKSATKIFPQGYIARFQGDEPAAVPNSIFTCFRVVDKEIVPAYLDYLFQGNLHGRWLKDYITVGARAHGALNISNDDLFELPIPLPSGDEALSEQLMIIECLGSLDDLIGAEKRKLEALFKHKQGLMQQLFPREGETQPQERFPEFHYAGGWIARPLKDMCDLKAGEFVQSREISKEWSKGLFPCYGGNGLRGFVSSFTHSGRYALIGRQGALCGNVNLVDEKFHATEHALVATPKSNIDIDWLYFALLHLNLNRFATGQAQPGLSVSVLNEVYASVPEHEDEQSRIADCLTSLDIWITAQLAKVEALRDHKFGLLQKMFPSTESTMGENE